jgi:hypothetical protein
MTRSKNIEPTSDTLASTTLLDLCRAAHHVGTRWALIGGQALIVHGVPRHSPDASALLPPTKMSALAEALVGRFGWTPLEYDERAGKYGKANAVAVHHVEDPGLDELKCERQMIPLRSALAMYVELVAAQHPVERHIIGAARVRSHLGSAVPVAPLGGLLLVQIRAGTVKDVGAIEQTVEHLSAARVEAAIAWARKHDRAGADKLRAVVEAVWKRRTPVRTVPTRRRLPPP